MTDHDDSEEADSGRSMYDASSGLVDEEATSSSANSPDTDVDGTAATDDSEGAVESEDPENSANSERSERSEDTERSEADDGIEEGVSAENRLMGQGFDEPLVSAGSGEPEQSTGTFYVKHVEESATTLHEIHTSQVYVVIENPDLEPGEIIEASLVAQPPMEVSYRFNEIRSRRTIPVEVSDLEPTRKVRDIAGRMDVGEAIAIEREGDGEIHILTVEPNQAGERAEEVSEDETTYKNAGRYEVDRVEIRTSEDEGIVSIRYLPD